MKIRGRDNVQGPSSYDSSPKQRERMLVRVIFGCLEFDPGFSEEMWPTI